MSAVDDPLLYQGRYRIPSTRLRAWDYTNPGLYFITICTHNKYPWFGHVKNGFMCLSSIGVIAYEYWLHIPDHFPHVTLDRFVVMPDHMHGIIRIHKSKPVETCESHVSTNENHIPRPKPGSLGSIINQYKTVCTKKIRLTHPNFTWQPRYHDHVIRDDDALVRIRKYITDNPANWHK